MGEIQPVKILLNSDSQMTTERVKCLSLRWSRSGMELVELFLQPVTKVKEINIGLFHSEESQFNVSNKMVLSQIIKSDQTLILGEKFIFGNTYCRWCSMWIMVW